MIKIESGKTYQTKNNRVVKMETWTGDDRPGFGNLQPLQANGEGQRYHWRIDGSFDTNNENSIGIPHEWDLVNEVKT